MTLPLHISCARCGDPLDAFADSGGVLYVDEVPVLSVFAEPHACSPERLDELGDDGERDDAHSFGRDSFTRAGATIAARCRCGGTVQAATVDALASAMINHLAPLGPCPHCGSGDVDRGATGLDLCNRCDGLSRGGEPVREAEAP